MISRINVVMNFTPDPDVTDHVYERKSGRVTSLQKSEDRGPILVHVTTVAKSANLLMAKRLNFSRLN